MNRITRFIKRLGITFFVTTIIVSMTSAVLAATLVSALIN